MIIQLKTDLLISSVLKISFSAPIYTYILYIPRAALSFLIETVEYYFLLHVMLFMFRLIRNLLYCLSLSGQARASTKLGIDRNAQLVLLYRSFFDKELSFNRLDQDLILDLLF